MINEQPYIDFSEHIDLQEFDSLHPEICRGIATSNHLAFHGLQVYHTGTVRPYSQGIKINPLSSVYNDWKKLPEDDPIKINGNDLTYNQLTSYLKFVQGAYDHYMSYILLDGGFQEDGIGEVGCHFPRLVNWILNLQTQGIFRILHSATLMALDAGGIPWEHRDPEDAVTGIFDPDAEPSSKEVSEFIHIKTDLDRPFYILHPTTHERTYINTRVAWWDERDWHGGEPINRPTYTLRINGRFSEEFKKQVGIENYIC